MASVPEHQLAAMIRHELVSHIAEKANVTDMAEMQVRVVECLKYLTLSSAGARGPIPVSREVDEVWHQLILETKEYINLCSLLPGKRLLHHTSLKRHSSIYSAEERLELWLSWLTSYVSYFGPIQHDRLKYWPALEWISKRMDWDIDKLNKFAQSINGDPGGSFPHT